MKELPATKMTKMLFLTVQRVFLCRIFNYIINLKDLTINELHVKVSILNSRLKLLESIKNDGYDNNVRNQEFCMQGLNTFFYTFLGSKRVYHFLYTVLQSHSGLPKASGDDSFLSSLKQ